MRVENSENISMLSRLINIGRLVEAIAAATYVSVLSNKFASSCSSMLRRLYSDGESLLDEIQ